MISCTEFIPAYSELFSFLEDKYGREEVDRFWEYLFAPTGSGIPLINFILKEGIRGCYSYWSGTLNEEAADFTMYLNEKKGWYMLVMHHCPSKGRLIELKDELGITPYHDYCLHCDSYRSAVEKIGLKYVFNCVESDKAACSILIYDPKVFDGKTYVDADTLVMDRRAADNEYFHPDFHSSMNMGIDYLGNKGGRAEVIEYLNRYTDNVYAKLKDKIKSQGVNAIKEKILDTYEKEKALDAVSVNIDENGALTVEVKYCPAVRHLKATGRAVSEWFSYSTETVMKRLADFAGVRFAMLSYDKETGSARYVFE